MVSAAPSSSGESGDLGGAPMPWDKTLRVIFVALFSAVGSFLFGLDIGYIGPIIECASFKRSVAHTQDIGSGEEGLIVSLFSFGAIFTAFPLISSYFVDEWGRRASIQLGSAVFVLGSAIQASATNLNFMLVGRFVSGMSIGLLSTVIVLYQSEVAPARMRGALSTLYQLMITLGIAVASLVDEFLVDKDEGWRTVIWIMCAPALVLCVGLSFMPRSPRWLIQKGRNAEALEVLRTIRPEKEAVLEAQEIQEELESSKAEGEPRWSDLFHGRIGRLVLLGVILQLLQQLVGMNAFMYFGPKIFKSIGLSANLFTTINNSVNFIATFPAIFLADVAGRRILMLWSSYAMLLSCTVMGITGLLFFQGDVKGGFTISSPNARWVFVGSVFFFVANFAYGFGPIVWVYCAEIFPMKYRARAVGLCTMANWVGNLLIAQFTPMLFHSIRFSTFFVFGLFCLIAVLVSNWLPETKGVPLELVGQLFDHKKGFRSTASKALLNETDSDDEEGINGNESDGI
ncbi:unnamed protein product [Polarella glacialis]|uniref:Hexose transporter 1 n=1 Tax=Polarella glacialis TaxID=89957 RepID=A0A813LL94_POLGL|nr:unnamed protein product [Polarella glacialis]CAE8641059.1 unnamed protein product [Polarella glacialis]CAE8727557.1 unnamed protein product [Polarella glacialis]